VSDGVSPHSLRSYFKRATGDHVVKATSASDWAKSMEEFPISVLVVTDDDSQDGTIQVTQLPHHFPQCCANLCTMLGQAMLALAITFSY
jgi:hypothetical protein